ncbi:C-C motif chemokine 19-like isoform X2 [Genypterus blacodes]|uniref:C-C motif chemokine 19-like isoform X2 n=1 Tax=Genypterus blacodes TaxID=154954 RepID=UPI003F770564
MAPVIMVTTTTVFLCVVLGLLGPATTARARSSRGCCTRYYREPVPFQIIKGYREQTIWENCRIEAIILYTIKKKEICATRKDKWVRKILELLSSKLKKMSKNRFAAGGATTKKPDNLSADGDSGDSFSSTETFPDFFSSDENLSTMSNITASF